MLQRFELSHAVRSIPERILYFAELWMGGMFLQDEAYVYMRERLNPFASGLLFVTLVGVVIAVADIAGAFVNYFTAPSLDAVRNIILTHLQAMPFYESMGPLTQRAFEASFNRMWALFEPMFIRYPNTQTQVTQLLFGLIFTPLGLVFSWLYFGALAHWMARKWNREISWGEMLGPLALAMAPQLLNALKVFPSGSVIFWVVYLWFFACATNAIRVTYRTTLANAFRAAFFPVLMSFVLVALLIVGGLLWFVMRGGQ